MLTPILAFGFEEIPLSVSWESPLTAKEGIPPFFFVIIFILLLQELPFGKQDVLRNISLIYIHDGYRWVLR